MNAALAGEEQHFEREMVRPGATTIHVKAHYIPDRRDGLVRGYFVLFTDLSERQQAESRLSQLNADLALALDRAEAANSAKSVFLANISHEIRTPMNAIIGLTHLLRREVVAPRQRQWLEKVGNAADHLMGIINDVLDLSKIEAGKLTIEQTDFELAPLLNRTVALVSDSARDKNLPLLLACDDLPQHLRGDPTRLSQALLNLLSNAIKFTDVGSIEMRGEVVSRSANQVVLRFIVSDTGIGIPDTKLDSVFGAFDQADVSTTRRYGGTGLGLAITRHLAQLMGGEVRITSREGVGTRCTLTLRLGLSAPADPGPASRPGLRAPELNPRAAESSWNLAGARILLAEDNPINQEIAAELLQSASALVDVANDGRQAVEMVRSNHYDLVLMDMQMPVMDGLEATRAIRALPDRARLPIIAMTANAFGEDRQRCLDAGMNDHVGKPTNPNKLFETVRRWLAKG
jgi:signal transduction histidine kinase